MTLVCDTSVLYAALDRRDRNHRACAEALGQHVTPVVPSPTLVELDQLAHSRGAPRAILEVLAALLDGSFVLIAPDVDDHARIGTLIHEYADLPLGFVDASVIATAERLGETTVATLDRRHFSVVKPLHCRAFTLVP